MKPTTRQLAPLAVLVVCAAMAAPGLAVDVSERPTYWEIAYAVDEELMDDMSIQAMNVDVSVDDGVVTLDGTVPNVLAKDRAERIAEATRGVLSVVNRLEVEPRPRSNVQIREDVENAFQRDALTESWQIGTAVDNGVVTLTGDVESWQAKKEAERIAKSVIGVREVENRLEISDSSRRSDQDIRDDVAMNLRWDVRVDAAPIDVSVDGGEVTLTGTVGSAAEKRQARADAWVPGTEKVDVSGLQVKPWEGDEQVRADTTMTYSDEEVAGAVKRSFEFHPRVAEQEIEVSVDDGRVALRGTVENLKSRRAAAETARGVAGVWSVNNMIKVRPNTPSDRTIENNIGEAILWDPYLERYEIDVSVYDGEVYLYGSVDSTFEKAHADDVAARQDGVVMVHNYLDVENGAGIVYDYDPYVDDWYVYDYDWYMPTLDATTRSDWEILEDINDELFWSPFVDADEVAVTVDNGVATLTGTVDTWSERQSATENAYEGGAIAVDNNLDVEYGPDYYR